MNLLTQPRVANPRKFSNTKLAFQNRCEYIFEFPKYTWNSEKYMQNSLLNSY